MGGVFNPNYIYKKRFQSQFIAPILSESQIFTDYTDGADCLNQDFQDCWVLFALFIGVNLRKLTLICMYFSPSGAIGV